MKKITLALIVLIVLPYLAFSQDEEKNFGIKFSGFVKNDAFFDTRQTVTAREGHFLLYPTDSLFDANDNDINQGLNFNMLAIQTRLTGKITGPDAFGAKTSGLIEGAFFGHSDPDVNGFRLRHAFAKLNWEKTEFLAGQYWHPMFVTGCFPGVISFNTGVPFQPFSRNPQIRVTHKVGPFSIIAAVQSQRDFASPGGSTSLRNAGIPDMQFQLHFNKKNEEAGTEILAGLGGGYKMLKPALSTVGDSGKFASDEMVSGASAIAFFKYANPKFTVKFEGVFGQNMYDLLMLGGYAYKFGSYDSATGSISYTTIDNLSAWFEIHGNGKKIQPGLFAGYTQNLGSTENIYDWTNEDSPTQSSFFARGASDSPNKSIAYIYRVSPRVVFISGKFQFALEAEYTVAAYARADEENPTGANSLGEVQKSQETANIRGLFSVIYSF
ncbi:MAG: hypothetical protein KKA07_06495 [Bacteroidetes bacterium]|nr:hypothetical protein [Bacteroidota bacterium]